VNFHGRNLSKVFIRRKRRKARLLSGLVLKQGLWKMRKK